MSKTVYIIDDDPLIRFIVERMLSKIDKTLEFIQCENGKIGLDKLKSHQVDFSQCIILLDLNMPVLDGWGFLDEIQSGTLKDHQFMTIYILSSSTDKSDLEKTKEYSIVKKFYHKPLSVVDINELLNL